MIDTIIKKTNRWLCIGLLATAGCAGNVKQEEFNSYRIEAEMAERELKEQIAELKRKDMEAQAHYGALLKEIEEINARLSVSSVDNYSIALEEQLTQHARHYVQLARAIAALQKKDWDLGDTTEREISKLREDMKANYDSLSARTADLKKLYEESRKAYEEFRNEDYTIFKGEVLEVTLEHQKKIGELKTNQKNLENNIQSLDKAAGPVKESEGKGTHDAGLNEQPERYRQLVKTGNEEFDALNQRLFERDKKEYVEEKAALKSSYADKELQRQIGILREKYAHLFENNK